MKRLLIVGGLLATLALGVWGGYSLAQQLVIQGLSGQEAVLMQNGGPGGGGFFTNSAVLREGQDYLTIGPGGTSTYTVSGNTIGNLITVGTFTTLNLSLPTNPYNGEIFRFACPGGTVTTLTLSAPYGGVGSPAIINPATVITGLNPTTCVSGSGTSMAITLTYQTTPSTWFRIQ